MGWMISVESW